MANRSEYQKQYREQNKERLKQYIKEYHIKNSDKIKQQRKKYVENNKGKVSLKLKQYYENHKEQIIEYTHKYNEQHKKEICNRFVAYYNTHKQKYFDRVLKRKRNIEIVEHVDKDVLRGMYDNKCVYCGCELGDKFHTDHMLSVARHQKISKKTPHSYDNCVPACVKCNEQKSDKTPLEFMWDKRLITA